MTELLRTYQQVTNALLLAVCRVMLPGKVPFAAIEELRRIRTICDDLASVDPPLRQLLTAIDLWFTQLKQFRATGAAKLRGGAIELPGYAADGLSEATRIFARMINPHADMPARQRADAMDIEDAQQHATRRMADDEIEW